MNDPPADAHLDGGAIFSGWALSPYGIRKVDLLFDSGATRMNAPLREEPSLHALFPWYDATVRPRFVLALPRRPPGVRMQTNVQVEITDGRGSVTHLEGRRLYWK